MKITTTLPDIKCPHCGASHLLELYSSSTALDCPTVIKEGKIISTNCNIVTTKYECLNCGKTFTAGKIMI